MKYWDSSRGPFIVSNAILCLYHVSIWRYSPSKLPISWEVVEKLWKSVFGSPIFKGRKGGHLKLWNMDTHFQTWLTSEHAAKFGRVPFSELQGQLTQKQDEELNNWGKTEWWCRLQRAAITTSRSINTKQTTIHLNTPQYTSIHLNTLKLVCKQHWQFALRTTTAALRHQRQVYKEDRIWR